MLLRRVLLLLDCGSSLKRPPVFVNCQQVGSIWILSALLRFNVSACPVRQDQTSTRGTRSPSLVPSLVSVSSTSSQRSLPAPFSTWHTSGPIPTGDFPPARYDLEPDNTVQNTVSSDRLAHGPASEQTPFLADRSAFEEYVRAGRVGSDRWTQARQRRRELQDALLAEEDRLLRTYGTLSIDVILGSASCLYCA